MRAFAHENVKPSAPSATASPRLLLSPRFPPLALALMAFLGVPAAISFTAEQGNWRHGLSESIVYPRHIRKQAWAGETPKGCLWRPYGDARL